MSSLARQIGFTLIEIAFVLLIMGLLTKTFVGPMASAQKHKLYTTTEAELQAIKEGLLAYVVATGVLPCPIAVETPFASNASVQSSVVCNRSQGGVPAVTLSLSGAIDSQGALLDAWNRPYLYAVSLSSHSTRGDASSPDWLVVGEASSVGVPHLEASLKLCLHAAQGECSMNKTRASNLAFVVLSRGKIDSDVTDEIENRDSDNIFVINDRSSDSLVEFDDQLVWSSKQEVMYWMLRAAWLP